MGFYASAKEKILHQGSIFMHLGEKKLLKLWTFLLGWGGGVLEHPQHPPRYGPDEAHRLGGFIVYPLE